MKDGIYYSLDEAAEEIKKRWNDLELKCKVENFLSSNFLPGLSKDTQRAVYAKSVVSPHNSYDFFYLSAKYLNLKPLLAEYTKDIFTGISDEKLLLTRLRLVGDGGVCEVADIVDYKMYHEKMFPEVMVVTGEKLIDFHHNLFKLSQYSDCEMVDMSDYFQSYGKPKDFYPYYLANFICHGVLFEKFDANPKSRELKFTNNVALPAINFLKEKFGVGPVIVNLYSNDSTGAENIFWGCYNKSINDFLIDYTKKNDCPIREIK